MNLYERYLIPRVINCICGLKPTMRQREKIIPEASGIVLELGIGSGLNTSFYDSKRVTHLIGIDPNPYMKVLQEALSSSMLTSEILVQSAENLPFEKQSIDTIVSTYTMCTIPELAATMSECRRVLRKNGQLLFIEHGLSPDTSVSKVQNRINPFWRRISCGCQLNRDIPVLLNDNGFTISELSSMYLPGWKPATWNVWGKAIVA